MGYEKRPGGEMAKWVKWNERPLGQNGKYGGWGEKGRHMGGG